MAERWGNGWGWVGMRGPSLGRFLRGLRAEVNYIEGKRRKKRERGEKEKERKQCVRPGLLPPSPLPSWLSEKTRNKQESYRKQRQWLEMKRMSKAEAYSSTNN